MTTPLLVLRPATAADQDAIVTLVRGERLNPNGLHWPRFLLATLGSSVVGAVQMRQHRDGSCELGSLVVARDHRGRGLAARLIDRLLAQHDTAAAVHVITARANAAHYARWNFRPIAAAQAPRSVRLNHAIGQMAGVISLLRGRAPRRLVVLQRS